LAWESGLLNGNWTHNRKELLGKKNKLKGEGVFAFLFLFEEEFQMKTLIVKKEELRRHSRLIERFRHFGWQVVVK
jgi:hypothetical protein